VNRDKGQRGGRDQRSNGEMINKDESEEGRSREGRSQRLRNTKTATAIDFFLFSTNEQHEHQPPPCHVPRNDLLLSPPLHLFLPPPSHLSPSRGRVGRERRGVGLMRGMRMGPEGGWSGEHIMMSIDEEMRKKFLLLLVL
jgi:hypothetical protein